MRLCSAGEFVDSLSAAGGGRFTAVVTAFRDTAEKVISEVRARGGNVPDDLSVMTLTDMPDRSAFNADISAILTPVDAIARAALRMILDGQEGEVSSHQFFCPRLHPGHTVSQLAVEVGPSGASAEIGEMPAAT